MRKCPTCDSPKPDKMWSSCKSGICDDPFHEPEETQDERIQSLEDRIQELGAEMARLKEDIKWAGMGDDL